MKVAVIANGMGNALTASIVRAIKHFGIIYKVINNSEYVSFLNNIEQYACILVIGEDNFSIIDKDKTPEKLMNSIIKSGVGIVNFDYKYDIRSGKVLSNFKLTDSVHVTNNQHYITYFQPSGAVYSMLNPIEYAFSTEETGNVLLGTQDGHPLLTFAQIGKSRCVHFLVSPKLWSNEYLGHGEGLEDIIWRAIVWAAMKPLVMFAVPPFITARIDDCKGFDGFKYVDVLNEFGFVPNIGLFIDEVEESDSAKIRLLYQEKLAEFSPHAFRGREAIYGELNIGPASNRKLKDNFRRVDKFFSEHGIKPSKVNNSHFWEYGANSISLMQDRGQNFTMSMLLPDEIFTDICQDWKPAPYGHYGYCFAGLPGYSDFFMVRGDNLSHRLHEYLGDGTYRAKGSDEEMLLLMDFLWEKTSWRDPEAPNNVQGAIKTGVKNISLGLNNLFFGVMTTHEYLIEKLTTHEWKQIISGIKSELAKYEPIFKSYDYIAEYLLNRSRVKLYDVKYKANDKSISCSFRGNSNMPLLISIFTGEGDKISQCFEEIEPFRGDQTQRIKVDL